MGKRKPAADDLFGDLFASENADKSEVAADAGLVVTGDSGTEAAVASVVTCPPPTPPEVVIPDAISSSAPSSVAQVRLAFLAEGRQPSPCSIFDGGTKAPLTIFDIETIPLPWDEIERVIPPFEEPLPFDPSSVKTGEFDKLKDHAAAQQKRLAKIAERRAAYEEEAKGARQKYVDAALETACLNAMTCRVACIGYGHAGSGGTVILDGEQPEGTADERTLLVNFWSHLLAVRNGQRKMVGIYIKTYDLPMLIQRSYVHGVRIPSGVLRGRYYSDDLFTCLNEVWLSGMLNARVESDAKAIDRKWSKLNLLAKFLGVTMKTGELGKDFWFHWANERAKAIEYAKGDIISTMEVAQALQVME